jgi:hypothetical protein
LDAAGHLVSTGTVIDSDAIAAAGYSLQTLSGNPAGQIWDPATKSFSAPPIPSTVLSTWRFVQRFTPAEYAGIEGSTDAQVRMFLLMLQTSQTITVQDPVVQAGLQYLVSLNLLTSARATTIGSN